MAGQCGLGALDAAKEKGVQGIGVDADQAYLGPQILTSAIKKVDVAVLDTIKKVQDGKFKGGANTHVRRQANDGAGIGKIAPGRRQVPGRRSTRSQKKHRGRHDHEHPGHGQVDAGALTPTEPVPRSSPSSSAASPSASAPLVANDGVDFQLRRGEIHALLGENGAGKSTLMNVLYGHATARTRARSASAAGRSTVDSPREAMGLGIGMVFQHFMLIPVMTVAENLVLGAEPRAAAALLDVRAAARAGARAVRALRPARSTPTRASRTSPSASSSASRSCARWTAAPRSSSSTSRPRC